jgi:hypothetical protein
MPLPIRCTRCDRPLAGRLADYAGGAPCASCGSVLRVEAFPALLREPAAQRPATAPVLGEEATCFYHPTKQVAVVCSGCGRFLCALCDVELDGRHLCPRCVASGADALAIPKLDNSRVLYDDIAVSLAILPLLFFPLTIFTAPASLAVAVRNWNKPSSVIPRRPHARFAVAVTFASLEVAGWLALLVVSVT